MTDQKRSQIRSYQLDGLTPKQISELTGIAQNTVKFTAIDTRCPMRTSLITRGCAATAGNRLYRHPTRRRSGTARINAAWPGGKRMRQN